MKKLFLIVTFLACASAFAQVAPSPVPSIVASGLPVLDSISNAIPTSGSALGAIAAVLGFAVELVMRLWATSKPVSILLMIRAVLGQIAKLFQKLSDLLDKVIPQNLNQ